MGHQGSSDQVFQKFYTSEMVGIDIPSVVRGRSQDKEYINFARCISFSRDRNAPVSDGSRIDEVPHITPAWFREKLAKERPGTQPKNLYTSAKKKYLEMRREQYFANAERHQFPPEAGSPADDRLAPSYYCKTLLKYDHDRRAVVESLWGHAQSLEVVVRSLQTLANPATPSPHYYPKAEKLHYVHYPVTKVASECQRYK
jgi:hypothetical protein